MAKVCADIVESKDHDWQVDDFDGQTHFSDDGQFYQPIDPTVFTGASDATHTPPSSAYKSPTLPGDMPMHFDYLRRPGYASEFHARVLPAALSTRDRRKVVSFENPWTPFPKYNAPRREGVIAHFDRTVSYQDDAQGFGSDRLNPGEALTRGQAIKSRNGQFSAVLQQDGNFVVYKGGEWLWATGANGNVVRAVMQTDGNFVLYSQNMRALWDAGTQRHPGAFLVMQDDGNLVVYAGNTPLWSSGTQGGRRVTKGPGVLGAIGNVAKGAVGAVGGVVSGIARPVGGLLASPAHLVSDIAHGANVFGALKDTVKRDLSNVGAVAPYAQAVLSAVPGVGSGINGAIAAASAIAHGQPITDALVSGVRGMVPGGPLATEAFDTAIKVAKGGNVLTSALEGVRNQLPGGELAKRAFDSGVALAHGANLQQTLLAQGGDIAKGQAMSLLGDQIRALSPINNRVLSGAGPQFIGQTVERVISVVPSHLRNAGNALLQNPELRSLPIEDLARRLNLSPQSARDAVASLIATVQRAGGLSIAHMAPAEELARRIPTHMSFDQAMARYASGMGPIQTSVNAARRARPLVMSWMRGAQGYSPYIGEASGLDASGTKYIVESGDSMSKIAAKLTGSSSRVGELIRANPQVSDPNKIFVGQKLNLPTSWQTKAATPTVVPTMATTVSPTTATAPMPTLPAPIAATAPMLASTMPMISATARSSGAAVIAWQNILIRDNFAPAGSADGQFGPQTAARTKSWQSAHGLTADGVVGPKTWAAALATLPTSLPTAPAPAASAPIQTPIGPVSLPSIFTPTMATIPESPAAPIAAPIGMSPLPALPPMLPAALPPVGSTIGTTPVVTATQTGPSEVTVTQPTIEGAPPPKAGGTGLGPVIAALGALVLVGMGSGRKLF